MSDVAKRGRPQMPEGEARTEVINVRVTPDELAAIKKAAEKRGCSLSELCRERLVNDSKYLRELNAHALRLAARLNAIEYPPRAKRKD